MFNSDNVEVLRRVHRDICDHLPPYDTARRIIVAVALLEGARQGMSVSDLCLKGRSALEAPHV